MLSAHAHAHIGAASHVQHAWRCPNATREPLLRGLLGCLFAERLIPPGSIIDAGANTGEESCFLAEIQPKRIVHAVEPLVANVRYVREAYAAHLSNIVLHIGALGIEQGWHSSRRNTNVGGHASNVKAQQLVGFGVQLSSNGSTAAVDVPDDERAARGERGEFRLERIDDLFGPSGRWAGERLGFAHFDVEGSELSVLRGATRTIARDRPVFTVETFVHQKPALTAELLGFIASLGHTCVLIEEECGSPADCRNLLCFPLESAASLSASSALSFAAAAGKVVAVDAQMLPQLVCTPRIEPGTDTFYAFHQPSTTFHRLPSTFRDLPSTVHGLPPTFHGLPPTFHRLPSGVPVLRARRPVLPGRRRLRWRAAWTAPTEDLLPSGDGARVDAAACCRDAHEPLATACKAVQPAALPGAGAAEVGV